MFGSLLNYKYTVTKDTVFDTDKQNTVAWKLEALYKRSQNICP